MTLREIIVAVVIAWIADLFLDWSTTLSKSVARRAARRLPRKYRARWEEDWLADLEARPRALRLLSALDLFRGALGLRHEYRRNAWLKRGYLLPSDRLRELSFKRATDIVSSVYLLVFSGPLLLLISVAIKVSSRGPILMRQRLYGPDGHIIEVYRFRSVALSPTKSLRVTRVGAFVRRTSLDELPQLINVLEGTLSLVGPRAQSKVSHDVYRKFRQGKKLGVKPGLIGLAQVDNVWNDRESVENNVERIAQLDADYAKTWSLFLDLKILIKTMWVVLRRTYWRD